MELELKQRVAHVGLEEAGDLVVAQPSPLLGLLADGGRIGPEVDDGRGDALPLAVGDHLGPAVGIAAGDRRVGRSQVDADEGGTSRRFPGHQSSVVSKLETSVPIHHCDSSRSLASGVPHVGEASTG